MEQTFQLLTPDVIHANWSVLRELLDLAVKHGHGEYEVDDLLPQVDEGRTGIFALYEGDVIKLAISFEVIKYPRRTILFVSLAGGKGGRALAANFGKVEEAARVLGADAIRCACRPEIAATIQHFFPDSQQMYQIIERKLP